MKTVAANFGPLRNATDAAAAAAPAGTLADTFNKVADFWKAHNAPDAVTLAETARDAARAIATGTGDFAANKMKLQGTCGACHMAHREGKAPDFKIKY
jgi:mono/diheme cytochrome c family protein